MISGMLTAVQDFVHDSFVETEGAELDTVELGEFNVWIQHGPKALLCAVVTGTPPRELRDALQRTLEELHCQLRFRAVSDTTAARTRHLACGPCFRPAWLGQQTIERKPGTSRAWLWVVLPVTALLLALAVGWLVQRHRWNQAIENLRTQPGIVLTSEESLWRGYRLTGLRDPMAVDPAQIIRHVGIDPSKVNAHWEQYFSLDPSFELPRRIAEEKLRIEQQVILFRVDSSELDPEQLLKLTDVESSLRKLQSYTAAAHKNLKVEIAGHTDPTGKEERNAALSEQRANAVIDALTDRGIAPESFLPVAMASRAPVALKGSNLAELSRRVTFQVVMDDKKQ